VEQLHHRVREVRWGPRTLDVDIVAYADLALDTGELTLPHPRAAERAFVLQPWAWMDPEATLGGVRVADLAARAADRDGLALFGADSAEPTDRLP
jgi:2-amino-4-hydroxy-6-hydroxymethyldihydropteridine diphosphokinase